MATVKFNPNTGKPLAKGATTTFQGKTYTGGSTAITGTSSGGGGGGSSSSSSSSGGSSGGGSSAPAVKPPNDPSNQYNTQTGAINTNWVNYKAPAPAPAPAPVTTNEFNTITGAKLGAGQSYVDAQGRTVTQGSNLGTYGTAPAPIQSQLNTAQNNSTPAYSGVSIVDYLGSLGKPSDYNSRAGLATQNGITNYQGTAAQNTQLLNSLRSGTTGTPTPTNAPTGTTAPNINQNNDYSTIDGHKLVQGETYTNAQGQTITQGTPIQGQMGAIPDPNITPPVAPVIQPEVPNTRLAELEQQFKALLGQSNEEQNAISEEEIARQNIQNQDNAYRGGVQDVGEQSINMNFISGQQADLEKRNTNLQIPLQQKLEAAQRNRANAEARRQSSIDSIKFDLERADKASATAYTRTQDTADEAYRQKALAATIANNTANNARLAKGGSVTPSTTDQKKLLTQTLLTGIAPSGQKIGNPKGADGFVDPGVYLEIFKQWTGTTSAFLTAFPVKNVNPLSYKLLPEAIRPTGGSSSSSNPY